MPTHRLHSGSKPGSSNAKKVAMVAGALTAGAATRYAWRHTVARQPRYTIADDLRSPLLPLVSAPYTPMTLPFLRAAFRTPRWSGPGVSVRTQHAGTTPTTPDVPVRVTTPSGRTGPRPAVLWIHAGGFITGSPQFEGPMTGFLARALDAVVISPDYRLAPESPFPAALDDCMATLRWLRSNADRLGVDPDRIAVAGSSAGGGLAAALAQRCTDEHIKLRAQALLYPMLDDRTALGISHGAPVWSGTSNRFAWTCYLGTEPDIAQAPRHAAPARATDLGSSPPTWLAVGALDVLCAEAVEFAGRLKRADVECDLTVVPGMYHAADVLVPWARSMRQLRHDLAAHLQRHLAS